MGHQCLNLRKTFSPERGRIILQDLPQVVKGKVLSEVEVMAHDMMQPQPIVGKHVSFLEKLY